MIQGADWLCRKHFGRGLIDKNVEILDPATGTGTFITELIEHFRGDKVKLAHKYKEELHANEVAILPYYVANLNIESTFAAITSRYEEFQNLCFVDTLDNVAPLGHRAGHQHDLFASFTEENVKRVKRQNARKISVIIGNPPYNANQQNENDNNKNRDYPKIDELIKATYIKASDAQKTKAYDMYARFFRWASDRLDVNGDGIIAFITNRSFVDRRTFDGFRRTVAQEFNEIWVLDVGGDVRLNPKLSGTTHNVFGIQIGVAISFFVRKKGSKGCTIRYARRPEFEIARDKLAFLSASNLSRVEFTDVVPDASGNWIDQTDNDLSTFLPVADKETRDNVVRGQDRAIFKLFTLGISTNRDEWLYDTNRDQLARKIRALINEYDNLVVEDQNDDPTIKWSETLRRRKAAGQREAFNEQFLRKAAYRPFTAAWHYQSPLFVDRPALMAEIFPPNVANTAICFTDPSAQKPWLASSVTALPDLHYVGAAAGTICLARSRFAGEEEFENITDWALNKFRENYERGKGRRVRPITKDAIFSYVYGVLHDPLYREKYALNLKREFPRIPFYQAFWQWADWGTALLKLHANYEAAEPFKLKRSDTIDEKARSARTNPKPLVRSDQSAGSIALDTETTLSGVPEQAWAYLLGSRNAIDWVLDQHKEKTPKDPIIKAKFNTYRFAEQKEAVIKLLERVTTISVETMKIVDAMRKFPRPPQSDAPEPG